MEDTALDGPQSQPVDFWFDPTCPWAWITSRWLREVAEHRPLSLRWHLMSLTILNEARADLNEKWHRDLARRLEPVRVCAAAEQKHGPEALGQLYTELGTLIHLRSSPLEAATYAAALSAAGLDPGLSEVALTTVFDDAVRASHEAGIRHVGPDVGTPIIAVGDVAFFGPVMSPAPRGDHAVQLWDAVLTLAGAQGFFELKRTRTRSPILSEAH